MQAELHTDGALRMKTGQGGWAAIAYFEDGNTLKVSGRVQPGSVPPATNQRMEMQAVITGLNVLGEAVGVTVTTDSQYVAYTMTRGWWKRRVNADLWEALDVAVARHPFVGWNWQPRNSTDGLIWCDEEAKRQSKVAQLTKGE